MLHDFSRSDFEKLGFRFDFHPRARTAGVTHGDGAGIVMRHCPEHVHEFIFIFRLHVHPIGDVPEITDIEQTMVRWAIVAA